MSWVTPTTLVNQSISCLWVVSRVKNICQLQARHLSISSIRMVETNLLICIRGLVSIRLTQESQVIHNSSPVRFPHFHINHWDQRCFQLIFPQKIQDLFLNDFSSHGPTLQFPVHGPQVEVIILLYPCHHLFPFTGKNWGTGCTTSLHSASFSQVRAESPYPP